MSQEMDHNHAPVNLRMERDLMQTPEDVAVIMKLHQLGWGKKRIARELGISKNTVWRYLKQGGWKPYRQPERKGALDKHEAWLREKFLQHRGNAEVVRQELEETHGLKVSLRTVERAVMPYRKELEAKAKATIRFETAPGRQMQIDFGSTKIEIGGELIKVFLFAAMLGFSRRIYVQAFKNEKQSSWLAGMDGALRHFEGIPEEVLLDNAKSLVLSHNAETREVRFNDRLLSFANYWGFKPRACAPYRARTKGKDERVVGYVKGNAIAGRVFPSWDALQGHLQAWSRNIADQRIHATTREKPHDRFEREERQALTPLNGKPPFFQGRDYQRKVHADAHVEFETNRYSVPWKHVGEKVTVRHSQNRVLIIMRGEEITSHEHQPGKWQQVTNRSHLSGIIGNSQASTDKCLVISNAKHGELQRPLSEYEAVAGGAS